MRQVKPKLNKRMKRRKNLVSCVIALSATLTAFTPQQASAAIEVGSRSTTIGTGNPYLPLWEHLPDGEPRVFEDPDNPGK